jgi:hypothetical protein
VKPSLDYEQAIIQGVKMEAKTGTWTEKKV